MKSAIVPAGEFKSRCLRLLDEVAATRQTLVVTKRGRPVAHVTPVPQQGDFVGSMRETAEILGDIVAPADVAWEAMR
jgi:prevent-host-death family protein